MRELAASVRMAGIPTVAILAWRYHCSPYLVFWVPECPLKLNVMPKKWLLLQLLKSKCLVNIKVIILVTISYTWLMMTVAYMCAYMHMYVCVCALTNLWEWCYSLHIWKGHMIMLTLPLFSDKQNTFSEANYSWERGSGQVYRMCIKNGAHKRYLSHVPKDSGTHTLLKLKKWCT